MKELILTLHILKFFLWGKGEETPKRVKETLGEEGELRSVKELSRQQISSGLGGSHSHRINRHPQSYTLQ